MKEIAREKNFRLDRVLFYWLILVEDIQLLKIAGPLRKLRHSLPHISNVMATEYKSSIFVVNEDKTEYDIVNQE